MGLSRTLTANLLMLLTAAIWGLAFVGQRAAMDHIGPQSFIAVKFFIGCIALLPVYYYFRNTPAVRPGHSIKLLWWGGLAAGFFLFTGSMLQQLGLVHTTAGKAGFITGLYMIFVPLIGLLWGQRSSTESWIGVALSVFGLYLLSFTEDFTMAWGDLLVLIGAVFWAGHVLVIGWLSPKVSAIRLTLLQCFIAGVASAVMAAFNETLSFAEIEAAIWPLLYLGVFSTAIAYTLQVYAQGIAHPTHAALILSLEALFAAVGGWLILNELLGTRGIIGCTLMLAGMMVAQVKLFPIRAPVNAQSKE